MKLSKLVTIGYVVAMLCLALQRTAFAADDDSSTPRTATNITSAAPMSLGLAKFCDDKYKSIHPEDTAETGFDNWAATYSPCRQAAANDGKNCRTLGDDFDKALGKFKAACGNIGRSSDANECAQDFKDCQNSKSKDDDDEKSASYCPKKGSDFRKLQDDAEKAQDDVNKLNNDLANNADKQAEAQQQAQEKISQLQDRAQKATAELATAQQQMQKNLSHQLTEGQRQAVQNIQNLQDAYDKSINDDKGISVQKRQARVKVLDEPMANLRITCHQQAIQRVGQKRADALAKIAQSKYTLGGLNAMMRTLGLTDMQRDQIFARRLELMCLNDSEYKIRSQNLMEEYRTTLADLQRQHEGLVKQQDRIVQRIGMAERQAQLDRNQAYQDAQGDLQSARTKYNSDIQSIQTQIANAQQADAVKEAALARQNALKQSQIDQKQGYLNNKQAFAKAAEEAAKGTDYSKEDASKAYTALGDASAAAMSAARNCKCTEVSCESMKSFYSAATGSTLDFSKDTSPIADPAQPANYQAQQQQLQTQPQGTTTPQPPARDPAAATTGPPETGHNNIIINNYGGAAPNIQNGN